MKELMRCIRIGKIPVQTLVGTRPSLRKQPRYETLGELRVDIQTNLVTKDL